MSYLERLFVTRNNEGKDWRLSPTAIIFLILGGFVSTFSVLPAVIGWTIVYLYSLYYFSVGKTKSIWYLIAVSPCLEVFGRMTRSYILPHEIGKYYIYFCILLFSLSLMKGKTSIFKAKFLTGQLIIISFAPSIIASSIYVIFSYSDFLVHCSAMVQISMLLIFASKERFTTNEYIKLFKFIALPIIPILMFLTIKTPKFDDLTFNTASSFETTGGFGSNQVATILGLGLAVITILLFLKKYIVNYFILNVSLVLYLLFRAFISFSRGGVVVAGIAILVFVFIYSMKSAAAMKKYTLYITLSILAIIIIFDFANELSGNKLFLRYTGQKENANTEITVNAITSNRTSIAVTDIYMFADNIAFGVGPGQSRYNREKYGGFPIVPHTEYTRLLSEHGIGGLLVVIILSLFPFYWIRRLPSFEVKAISMALFVIAIGSSMHSATRTNTTVVCYALASIPILNKRRKTIYKDSNIQLENNVIENG